MASKAKDDPRVTVGVQKGRILIEGEIGGVAFSREEWPAIRAEIDYYVAYKRDPYEEYMLADVASMMESLPEKGTK